MRIAICDNELFYVQNISERIRQFELQKNEFNIIDEYTCGQELLNQFQREPYDLVFLDIELNEQYSGIDVAKKIKTMKTNCIFIFITAYHQYYPESMWLGADLFIDKPIDNDLFMKELQHAFQVYKQLNRTILFSTTEGKVYIKTNQILYLETSYGKYKLKTVNHHYFGNIKTITKAKQQLLDYQFFPLNRSLIINFKYVRSFHFAHIIMSNDDILPLTKRIRKEFKEKYYDYIDKEM